MSGIFGGSHHDRWLQQQADEHYGVFDDLEPEEELEFPGRTRIKFRKDEEE